MTIHHRDFGEEPRKYTREELMSKIRLLGEAIKVLVTDNPGLQTLTGEHVATVFHANMAVEMYRTWANPNGTMQNEHSMELNSHVDYMEKLQRKVSTLVRSLHA